jgi:hypothetical protein
MVFMKATPQRKLETVLSRRPTSDPGVDLTSSTHSSPPSSPLGRGRLANYPFGKLDLLNCDVLLVVSWKNSAGNDENKTIYPSSLIGGSL